MAAKLLGHRALFGKGLSRARIGDALAPYHREEVVLVLASLAALLSGAGAESAESQRALARAFFLESQKRVEAKIRAGHAVFHRLQVLVGLRLALAHCEGDRATQPAGAAFFEGLARVLAGVTDLLVPPRPPRPAKGWTARERLLVHVNHALRCDPLPPVEIAADCLRAHRLLFERAPALVRQGRVGDLAGAFRERHGVDCERWFAVGLHLLAKTQEYSLATMHERQPVMRVLSDFRHGAIEHRHVERLLALLSLGVHRQADIVRQALLAEGDGALTDLEALRRAPVIHLLEDTYAAADPGLLSDAIGGQVGSRLVGAAADRSEARRSWTALIRDHALPLLAKLTDALARDDLRHRTAEGGERAIADWYHVKGADAVLVWVTTATLRRDFAHDATLREGNGRLAGALEWVARETAATVEAWGAGLCRPGGKRLAQIKRIFPLLVLERDFPQDAAFHRLLAAHLKETGITLDRRCQPITTLDLATLEALAAMAKPPSLVALLAKRAGGRARAMPLGQFVEKQGMLRHVDRAETQARFEKLVKAVRKSLAVSM